MLCDDVDVQGAVEVMTRLRDTAVRDAVPVSGAFDLTYRCNLRCRHCYAGHLCAQPAGEAAELGTDDVLRLLAEAADAGCLLLLLSGGEPLLRPDFARIYTGARRLGMVVTVFTNATLVTEEHLEAFAEYPPQQVEVSLYGVTRATYERVTGVPGSYARAFSGLERLRERGLRVALKSMILRENVAEIPAMQRMAQAMGLGFRCDPLVTPRLDGDPRPLEQRVDPAVAVALELASDRRRDDTLDYVERVGEVRLGERAYSCGAGLTNFHIDPAGVLRPCLASRELEFEPLRTGFAAAWRAAVEAVERVRLAAGGACTECARAAYCGYCPGLFKLETGSFDRPADYVCRLGRSRDEALHISVIEEDRQLCTRDLA